MEIRSGLLKSLDQKGQLDHGRTFHDFSLPLSKKWRLNTGKPRLVLAILNLEKKLRCFIPSFCTLLCVEILHRNITFCWCVFWENSLKQCHSLLALCSLTFTFGMFQVIGTWDDHDYGLNDAGKEFSEKVTNQMLLLDFLDEPQDSPRLVNNFLYCS